MDDLRPPAPRTSVRTLAMVVAVALVAIAVAGIVIAVLRGRPQAEDALSTASAPAASASRSTRDGGDLNHIIFSADSDELSPAAIDHIKEMAESTKNATSAIVLSGKVESASDRGVRMDLAKKRINAVRRALQANGISPGRMRVEIAEYPVGRVPPREADIVEMNLR